MGIKENRAAIEKERGCLDACVRVCVCVRERERVAIRLFVTLAAMIPSLYDEVKP